MRDAAAQTRGVRLNYRLLVLGILFRFGEGIIAVPGVVREMFPHSGAPGDSDSLAATTKDPTASSRADIKEYRMASMIFGAASSPFMALYIKNKNALVLKDSFHEAALETTDNHYMDDYVTSFSDINWHESPQSPVPDTNHFST